MNCPHCGEEVPTYCDGIKRTRIDPFAYEIYEETKEIEVCEYKYQQIADDI